MGVMAGMKKWLKDLKKKSKKAYQSGWPQDTSTEQPQAVTGGNGWATQYVNVSTDSKKEDTRIEKKPVEVLNEILIEKPSIVVKDIDIQIKTIERRINVFTEQGYGNLGDENLALKFLKARKKGIKHYSKFNWITTTDDKINTLCSKYKLQVVGFSSYSRNVPMEAVDEMEKYVEAYECVAEDKPELKLIIDVGGKEQKKDPILLASSPFGRWYFILGAWDKEVQYVDDLVYNGK